MQERLYTKEEVLLMIDILANEKGSIKAAANEIGVVPDYLSMILSGIRKPSFAILDYFGLEKVDRYRKVKKETDDQET